MIKIENLRIGIPQEYNITKIELTNLSEKSKILIEGRNYVVGYGGTYDKKEFNVVNIREYKNLTNSSNAIYYFSINFKTVNFTSPNGKFILDIDSRRVLSDRYDEKIISFILGDYSCKNPCQGDVKNSILTIENNTLSVSYPEDYYNIYKNNSDAIKTLRQEFGLNMEDENAKRNALIQRQFGIALIVSGVLLFFQNLVRGIIKSKFGAESQI